MQAAFCDYHSTPTTLLPLPLPIYHYHHHTTLVGYHYHHTTTTTPPLPLPLRLTPLRLRLPQGQLDHIFTDHCDHLRTAATEDNGLVVRRTDSVGVVQGGTVRFIKGWPCFPGKL